MMPPHTTHTSEQVTNWQHERRTAWVERTGIDLAVQAASWFDHKNGHPGINQDLTRRTENPHG